MSGQDRVEVSLRKIDKRASKAALLPILILDIPPVVRNRFLRSGITTLEQLNALITGDIQPPTTITPGNLSRIEQALNDLHEMTAREISEEITVIAQGKPNSYLIKHPLLPSLAKPFFEATGHEFDDRVTSQNLIDWHREGRLRASALSTGYYVINSFDRDVETRRLLPDSLYEYESTLRVWDTIAIDRAFKYIHRGGFQNVGSIRRASEEQLKTLPRGTRVFASVGFGD